MTGLTEIFNDTTSILIADSLETYIGLGAQCLLFGFIFYSLLSLFSYGIIQVTRLFNINHD